MRRTLPFLLSLSMLGLGCSDPEGEGGGPRDAGHRPDGSGGNPDGASGNPDGSTGGPDGAIGHPDGGGAAVCDPTCGLGTVCVDGACASAITGVAAIDDVLLGDPTTFDTEVLISEQPNGTWQPSTIYKWRDFVQAVTAMYTRGVGDFRLWLGDEGVSDEVRARYALVNLAAFLAQSMKETIRYDACDENNWDNTNGYQISNACGQLGQNYADYDCEMACPRDPTMALTAVTHAKWYGAPGPLFCAPNATLAAVSGRSDGRTGRWNYAKDCWPYPASEPDFTPHDGPAWSRPVCEVYAGQRAGEYLWDGSGGSVEGCCWWGRGVIQTTGRCNFGTLNHYLGRTHLDPSQHPRAGDPLYPDLDFCANPESICSDTAHPELKWIAGLFYWMSSVQDYDVEGWSYRARLRAFVDGGMTDTSFIDAVSGIVNRGCHNPPCGTGPVDGGADRRANFETVLDAMGL